jgi:hypothetical protein
MKLRSKKQAVAAVALIALAASQVPARADNTADEFHLLKTRLKQLEEKVAKQNRKQKETEVQVHQSALAPPPPGIVWERQLL